jgi:hypothetical protein
MGWPMVRGFLGSFVLDQLGFTNQLSEIPAVAEDWAYEGGDTLDIADIVIISHLHVRMDDFVTDSLPPLDDIPAVQKLGGKGFTPELLRMLDHIAMKRISKPLAMVKQPITLTKDVTANQSDSDILTTS